MPIEPIEQTRLLDASRAVPGVIGGGVPGGTSIPFLINGRSSLYTPKQLCLLKERVQDGLRHCIHAHAAQRVR